MLDIRTILSNPKVFRAFLELIKLRRDIYVDEFVKPKPGDRILDFGCGTADVLEYLPNVHYFGYDLNPRYITAAQKRFGKRGTFKCQDVAEIVSLEPLAFDIVMANGVLHHLDDLSAKKILSLAGAALKPGGYLTTFDGCFTPTQPLIERVLLHMDRGRFVRTEPQYLRLVETAFGNVSSVLRQDLCSIPATILLMKAYPVATAVSKAASAKKIMAAAR